MELTNSDVITLNTLGWVRCSARTVADVPSEGTPATLDLKPEYIPALEGLAPGHFIYVIVYLHEANQSVFKASPGTDQQRGVFALRSSDRPNAIGMTLCRIEALRGSSIDVSWIDFSDGTPIIDIKRYSARWEIVFSVPRDDRRYFEQQVPLDALATVLLRSIRNFAGLCAPEAEFLAAAGAELIHKYNLFLGDPNLLLYVRGSGTLVDCIQGLTGASFGNKRLHAEISSDYACGGEVQLNLDKRSWNLCITSEGYSLVATTL